METEPNLVISSMGQSVVADGHRFEIEIYRLETDKLWTLEVVDHEGTSHVWDDRFTTDKEARNAALEALEQEGAAAFIGHDNIVQFPKSDT